MLSVIENVISILKNSIFFIELIVVLRSMINGLFYYYTLISGTGNWPVKELPFSETLNSYLEYYKVLAMRERNLKEKKTYSSPLIRGYSSFTVCNFALFTLYCFFHLCFKIVMLIIFKEKFGLTSMIARKRAGLPPLSLGGKENTQSNLPKIVPSVAVEDVEPLPDTYFTDLTKSNYFQLYKRFLLTWKIRTFLY